MATTEDIARLILEAETKGFADANAKVAATEAALAALTAGYKAGTTPLEDYFKEGRKLQAELDAIKGSLQMADAAVTKYGTAASAAAALADGAAKGTKNYGQSAMAASYALQDFTSVQGSFLQQLNSIQNNIPQILMGLGASGGLTAIISGLSVGFGIALPHIKSFIDALELAKVREFTGGIKELEERLKKLEAKPVKLAIDTFEIDQARKQLSKLQKDQDEFAALQGRRTSTEKESGRAVEQEFDNSETGPGVLAGRMKAQMVEHLAAQSVTIKEAEAKAEKARVEAEKFEKEAAGSWGEGKSAAEASALMQRRKQRDEQERAKKARLGIEKEAEGKVNETARESFEGNPAAQAELRKRLEAIGEKGLASRIGIHSPENTKAMRRDKEERERQEVDKADEREALNQELAEEVKDLDGFVKQIEVRMKADAKQQAASKKAEDEYNKKVTELAKGFETGLSGKAAIEGKLDLPGVIKRLVDSEVDRHTAEKYGPGVLAKVKEDTDAKVGAHAVAGGMTQAQARAELAKKAEDAANKPAEAAKEKGEKIRADAEKRRNAENQKLENAGIKAGGYVDQAAAYIAHLDAILRENQGQIVNKSGKMIRPTQDQLYAHVREEVGRTIGGQNRGMDPQQLGDISEIVASRALELFRNQTGAARQQAGRAQWAPKPTGHPKPHGLHSVPPTDPAGAIHPADPTPAMQGVQVTQVGMMGALSSQAQRLAAIERQNAANRLALARLQRDSMARHTTAQNVIEA